MRRAAIVMPLALTLLVGLLAAGPMPSGIHAMTIRAATPVPLTSPPPEICTEDQFSNWENVSEEPDGKHEWEVHPLDSPGVEPERTLYLVIITLEPGKCIPFGSPANQKNGAVILILHQGEIIYSAQPDADAPGAVVQVGDPDGPGDHPGVTVPFGSQQHLTVPGQWISQNDQVWFTYWNPSTTEPAVIWKVVWATPIPTTGCGGDCK
jgi:hypothetical protein